MNIPTYLKLKDSKPLSGRELNTALLEYNSRELTNCLRQAYDEKGLLEGRVTVVMNSLPPFHTKVDVDSFAAYLKHFLNSSGYPILKVNLHYEGILEKDQKYIIVTHLEFGQEPTEDPVEEFEPCMSLNVRARCNRFRNPNLELADLGVRDRELWEDLANDLKGSILDFHHAQVSFLYKGLDLSLTLKWGLENEDPEQSEASLQYPTLLMSLESMDTNNWFQVGCNVSLMKSLHWKDALMYLLKHSTIVFASHPEVSRVLSTLKDYPTVLISQCEDPNNKMECTGIPSDEDNSRFSNWNKFLKARDEYYVIVQGSKKIKFSIQGLLIQVELVTDFGGVAWMTLEPLDDRVKWFQLRTPLSQNPWEYLLDALLAHKKVRKSIKKLQR